MNDDNEVIRSLVDKIEKLKPGKPLRHYIGHIQFPSFKSIEPGTRINFDFPLTALVGPNGIGKSSVLHALYGAPFGQSTSRYWFATALDPIVGVPRFFYSYWHEEFGGYVETVKARIGKAREFEYWEPGRLRVKDGMQPLPPDDYPGKTKDRWNPVKRHVEYINLKATFGSFDRYFHFDEGGATLVERNAAMQREAKRLKTIIDENRQSYRMGTRQRIDTNRALDPDELTAISRVLGREYQGAQYVRHSLFPGNRGLDLSVYFNRGQRYSEAFAGSGEIAATSAIVQIMKAPEYSLILLDEPETSLHPGAQRELLRFLLQQILERKLQVVLSTHSMDFLEGLPHKAIKVFEDNGAEKARVLPSSSPAAALVRLGKLPANRRRVLVEDIMAAILLERAMDDLDPGDARSLEVKIAPGGGEAILKYIGPAAMVSDDDVYVYLDGDQQKVPSFTDPQSVAPGNHHELPSLIKSETGVEPMFHLPGGAGTYAHREAKAENHLRYFAWLRKRVRYLPRKIPEVSFLLALDPAGNHDVRSSADAKIVLRSRLTKDMPMSSAELSGLAKVAAREIPADHPDLVEIRFTLKTWLNGN